MAMVDTQAMARNITSPEARELAQELAAIECVSVTEAVTIALREALELRRVDAITAKRLSKMQVIADRFADERAKTPGPTMWQISEDLYNDMGLPR